MNKLKEEIINILKTPQLASLATISEDNKPWVRYMMIFTDDKLHIRAASYVSSRKNKEILNNPEVHIACGFGNPSKQANYLQIQAKASVTTDEKVKKAAWSPGFATYFTGHDDPSYSVIEIEPYKIELWKAGSTTSSVLDL